MSSRQEELRRRREELQWVCAAQRLELQTHIDGIENHLGWLDRGIASVQRLGRSPYLTAAAIAAFFLLGPGRLFRILGWASRAAVLVSAFKKFRR